MDMQNFDVKPTAQEIIEKDLPHDRKLKNKNPPFKDTILIPNPGLLITPIIKSIINHVP
jgi:hypothetical protein